MHEMSVAQNILEIVQEHVSPNSGENVCKIKLKIGELAGVVPDSLSFCFDIIKADSPFPNAALDVEYVQIFARCRMCKKVSRLEYGVFICPVCFKSDIELLTGNELNIVEIELSH